MATRTTDPWTSHAADKSVKNSEQKVNAVLRLLRNGMIDEDLIFHYQNESLEGKLPWASESGLRTLRNILWKKGWILDSGKTLQTRSGRQAVVWITNELVSYHDISGNFSTRKRMGINPKFSPRNQTLPRFNRNRLDERTQ